MERRSFSEYEQRTIRLLVEKAGDSVDFLLVNVYNDLFFFTNVAYIENELHFFYKSKEFAADNNGKYSLSIKKDLIIKTLLLKYLVDNRKDRIIRSGVKTRPAGATYEQIARIITQ